MDCVMFYSCYDYNDEWYLIEMLLDISAEEIDLDNMIVPQDGLDKDSWQVPYMEQYLDESGTKKVCDTYTTPVTEVKPCRIAFFIYKAGANMLHTPYGDFVLQPAGKVPQRLETIIEFNETD